MSYNKLKNSLKKHAVLLPIIFISLAIRFIFSMTITIPILVADSPTYLDGAKYLFEYLFIDMYRPPVYLFGIILTSLVTGWGPQSLGIIYVQIVFSIITVILAYDICRSLTGNRIFTFVTCIMIGASVSVFGWDFVIMSENFSITFLTLSVWLLIQFFRTRSLKYLNMLNVTVALLFFTKPFFLVYPLLILIIVLLRHILARDIDIRISLINLTTGLILIYICAAGYSALNYSQNNYFGFSAVGNVNSFGKILQYHMEDLGNNEKLKQEIKEAYTTAVGEDLVEEDYLEPWRFIGKYDLWEENYKEVGDFASYIMKHHPIKYSVESIKLLGKVFISLPPYRDYIAISAVQDSGTASGFIEGLAKLYERFDFIYYFMVLGLIEITYTLFSNIKAFQGKMFNIAIIVLVVLYHYTVGIFFSYGDYCRLLAPSYILMYILMNYYVYKIISTAAAIFRKFFRIKQGLSH